MAYLDAGRESEMLAYMLTYCSACSPGQAAELREVRSDLNAVRLEESDEGGLGEEDRIVLGQCACEGDEKEVSERDAT